MRPWALRQAGRTYGHLPEADRLAAVDAALGDLAGRGVADDARAARFAVADDLTRRLREAHVAWCHRPNAVDAAPTTPHAPATVADVVERGLGGLERAVMQLEIGAGRDTHSSRAALRLSPRDYTRHRREGLAKLRAAVGGQVAGHVCDGHAADVVLAATGDEAARERLGTGRDRCRSCAREATGLRRVLHQRLGLAPWPLTIKPMGALAAKLAGIGGGAAGAGTLAGSGAAGGGGLFSGVTGGAGAVAATVATVAAVAGGTFAVVHDRDTERPQPAATRAAATAAPTAVPSRKAATPTPAPTERAVAPKRRRRTASKPTRSARPAAPATPAATAAPAGGSSAATTPSKTAAAPAATPAPTAAPPRVSDVAADLTGTVEDTTAPVTGALPPAVGEPVQDTVTGVGDVVGGAGSTVDGLLTP